MHAAMSMRMVIGMAVRMGGGAVRCLRRSVHGMCFFAKIDRAELEFAEESHEPQAEHIKGGKAGSENADAPDHRAAVRAVKHSAKNFVFAEEAGKRRNSGDGDGCDRDYP